MKILFIQKRPLLPPVTGGLIRTYNILQFLSQWHEITYLCNLQPQEQSRLPERLLPDMELITFPWREIPRCGMAFYGSLVKNLFSPYPYNVAKDYDHALRCAASRLLHTRNYDLLICDFVQMALNVRQLDHVPRLLFQHNVEAQVFARQAETERKPLHRAYLALQAHKMRRFERQAGSWFDRVIAISPQDALTFRQWYGWKHVEVIDTAVDVDYFAPRPGCEESHLVVFVGSLDWLPNEQGLKYFLRQVWPLVQHAVPQAALEIVGRNPPRSMWRWQSEAGVRVIGTVPDVRPYLARAAVVIVPLMSGGGTRLKIYEALAMKKAVVSTSLGAEGLSVTHGQHLWLADDPFTFARALITLLKDPVQRAELGERGYQHVTQHFRAEAVARQFEAICLDTVQSRMLPHHSPMPAPEMTPA